MATPLVLDANSVIARAIYASALDDLRAGGVFTGGVFGALGSLRSIAVSAEIQPGLIVAFFDKGVPPARLKLLPDYKQKRKERKELLSEDDKEKAFRQLRMCYDMWPLLGVQCLAYRDREADDGVAAAARLLIDAGETPVIVTSDRDLWQTIAWGARVYDLKTNSIIDADNFNEFTDDIPLHQWLLYKAIIGDASDSIDGVPGCGSKRAKQLLEEFLAECSETDPHKQLRRLVAEVREAVRTRSPRKFEQSLIDTEERMHNVLDAIDLSSSFGKTDGLQARLQDPPKVQTRKFLAMCQKLKFGSVLGDPRRTLDPFVEAETRRRK